MTHLRPPELTQQLFGRPAAQPQAAVRPADPPVAQTEALAQHGGTDALGVPLWDFSTNANACGPCPSALAALQAADPVPYPDPNYHALRQRLAALHRVSPARIVLAASASEALFRLSAWARLQGVTRVHGSAQLYADCARAARAWGLQASASGVGALCWACEPSTPLGQAHTDWWLDSAALSVLDCAYAPLRLGGRPSLSAAQRARLWQLYSPNKALGLTGVRAAYLIAPYASQTGVKADFSLQVAGLVNLAPSWPIGAHGVALLHAWTSADAQTWLAQCRPTLRRWRARQVACLQALGWLCQPSQTPYFCAQPPQPLNLDALRAAHGVKLRDASSFGLPGWYRLRVMPPPAQDALVQALRSCAASSAPPHSPLSSPQGNCL